MAQKERRKIPVGDSDYKTIIEDNLYFVDKTLLIKEILETDGRVKLIPRPRRFGKTLNMSMLSYFFEKPVDPGTGELAEKKNAHLFKGKKIEQCSKSMKQMGQWPTIFLSLREIKEGEWERAYDKFADFIYQEFLKHKYLVTSDKLTEEDKEICKMFFARNADRKYVDQSLKFLTEYLYKHHQKKVIVLIDEYDTPINYAYRNGYYDEMIEFCHSFYHAVFKDNKFLEFGIITGVMRMAKESIFSGLNNISVFGVTHDAFANKFGFTQDEVDVFLEEYGLSDLRDYVKEWYDGYQIGARKAAKNLYNPWSMIQFIANDGWFENYWDNTSDSHILQKIISYSGLDVKQKVDVLIQGEEIIEQVKEGIIFPGVEKIQNVSWSVLLYAGYLTVAGHTGVKGKSIYNLKIPNEEIRTAFIEIIEAAFVQAMPSEKMRNFFNAVVNGNHEKFEEIFQDVVLSSISMYDFLKKEPELSYHVFVLGMLAVFDTEYEAKSNREAGEGRYDIMMFPRNPGRPGIIIEFKKAEIKERLEAAADNALKQIHNKKYAHELRSKGVKKIIAFGVACKGKRVKVKMCIGDEV
jgi:hypothetical protein